MTLLVKRGVVVHWFSAIGFGRNNSLCVHVGNALTHMLSIIGSISQHRLNPKARKQSSRIRGFMRLTGTLVLGTPRLAASSRARLRAAFAARRAARF
jgi:hypothetical protein